MAYSLLQKTAVLTLATKHRNCIVVLCTSVTVPLM